MEVKVEFEDQKPFHVQSVVVRIHDGSVVPLATICSMMRW